MASILLWFSPGRLMETKSKRSVCHPRVGFNLIGFKRLAMLPLGINLALALAACGGLAVSTTSSSTNSPNPGSTTALTGDPDTPYSTKQNPKDFAFTLYQGQETLGAESLNFSDLQGKPMVLNFWAGLCPPCRAEMPEFQEFYDHYHDRVFLLGIDVGQFTSLGNRDDAQALLKQMGVTYPAGFTENAEIMRNFKVLGMPTTVFVNSEGEILRSWTGTLNLKTLSEITDQMLAQ